MGVVVYYDLQGHETDLLNPSVSDLFTEQGGLLLGISHPAPKFNLTPESIPFP